MVANILRDSGLSYATTNGDRIYICTQDPTTFTEATSTYAIANKTSVTVGSPTAGTVSGRKVVISGVTGGTITGTDDATHWALVRHGASELLATGTIDGSPVALTSGNTFSLTGAEIEIPA
jgi:hypothetical protein